MKSGSFTFLEHLGSVQACIGIALSLNKDTGARFGTGEGVIVARIAENKS
jgi:hypothetical protein